MGFWTDITKVVSDNWALHSNQSVQNLIDDGDSIDIGTVDAWDDGQKTEDTPFLDMVEEE